MLPFGAHVANLLQNLDVARSQLWSTVHNINLLDKPQADAAFAEFRETLAAINKAADELNRNAKAYDKEFRDAENEPEEEE